MKKALFAAGMLALLAAGCGSQTSLNTHAETSQVPTPVAPAEVPPQTQATPNSTSAHSDTDLNTSLKAIDANMTGLATDSTGIDASLNEQQAPAK